MTDHYVIIGNSAAAVGCIEGIRATDKQGRITLISDEPYHTYSRPLISYLLWGKTSEERMKYRPDDFYEKNGVRTLLGHRALAIDNVMKRVTLDDGEQIPYEKLLVATGSKPFVPPMNGLDLVTKKFSFMKLDDAHALADALTADARVLVIGAGLIGLKCVEGIKDRCGQITVVDLAPRILPSILDENGSALVQKFLEGKGIRFILSDSVDSFEANAATLKSGRKLDFDVLVLAVGVRPNTELVSAAGGEVNRGIVTNLRCETTLDDVYAAGDCALSHDITLDQDRILALLPNAYMQGYAAGVNMAGGDAKWDRAMAMNAIGFFGLHIITAGSYTGHVYEKSTEDSYKKLFYQDNKLKGFILIGDVMRAGIYTSLIREETPLDTVDFELICEKPQLMAFTRHERAKQLSTSH
ncbi:MAG: NAD(P)/FAD-dependent oxidoreductase [Clostridia bacterium]|nr:NAD(P)/FAD-dependent oxidoreductase [Clostridia bacterium]